VSRASNYLRAHREAEAMADFGRALQLDPDRADLCNRLAWSSITDPAPQQNLETALRLARRAVDLAPSQWQYWNTLGVAHYRLRHYPDAIAALDRSLRESNGQMAAFDLYFLAMCHAR